MVCRGTACDECIKRCERYHRKRRRSSPAVARFFKIMFGENHSKLMCLPPGFERRVKHLTNLETQIEDSSRRQWSVTLSLVNGSLAFQKGWEKFYLDHGLKEGYELVFNYIEGNHFTVNIFGTSACEITNFEKEIPPQRKRPKFYRGTTSEDESHLTAAVNSRDKPILASGNEFQNCKANLAVENADFRVSQRLPTSVNNKDPTCMMNRTDGCYEEEHRRNLHNLPSFEMENRTSAVNNPDLAKKVRELIHEILPMLDPPHTETEQHKSASDAKIYLSSNGVCEPTNPVGDDTMEQTKTSAEDAEMDVIETDLITDQSREKVDDARMAPHSRQAGGHTSNAFRNTFYDSKMKKAVSDNGCNFQDGKPESFTQSPSMGSSKIAERGHAVKSKLGEFSISSSAIKKPSGNEPAVVLNHSYSGVLEPIKPVEDAEIDVIGADLITSNSGHRKAVDSKTAHSHTEITEQSRKMVGDARMAPHSCQAGGHSCDTVTNKFYEKPSDNSKMKVVLDNVCNFQDGKQPESFGVSPCIGSSCNKMAEREHAAKSKFGEYPISSSAVKKPLGSRPIKEEVKMDDKANVFHQVSRGGKDPAVVWNHAQMKSPVVKVEPDLPYETGQLGTINPISTSPFSAVVKSQLYLELPIHIASGRRRNRNQTIVYLRDSTRRLWPVVYSVYVGGRALTVNWTKFCGQNNIKPGDKCWFKVVDPTLFIYKVDVSRCSA